MWCGLRLDLQNKLTLLLGWPASNHLVPQHGELDHRPWVGSASLWRPRVARAVTQLYSSAAICIGGVVCMPSEQRPPPLQCAVRTAKFVARKQWVVAGADDMFIRVYNHNTMEKLKEFEAHTDYIRWGCQMLLPGR